MVIRPHIQRWSTYVSRKEGEEWDNAHIIERGRRMAFTRARGSIPNVIPVTAEIDRQRIMEKYNLDGRTDNWLIERLAEKEKRNAGSVSA